MDYEKTKVSLSLEQEYELVKFCSVVKKMNKETAQACLIKVLKDMMVKDNLYKELVKKKWGL